MTKQKTKVNLSTQPITIAQSHAAQTLCAELRFNRDKLIDRLVKIEDALKFADHLATSPVKPLKFIKLT